MGKKIAYKFQPFNFQCSDFNTSLCVYINKFTYIFLFIFMRDYQLSAYFI